VKCHLISALLLTVAAIGCAKSDKSATLTPEPAIADFSVSPAYAPSETQAPLYTEAAPADTSLATGPYKVRKGDTLYSIAKSRYGDGRQYSRIVQANPGINPKSLQVGQTITIP